MNMPNWEPSAGGAKPNSAATSQHAGEAVAGIGNQGHLGVLEEDEPAERADSGGFAGGFHSALILEMAAAVAIFAAWYLAHR